MIAGRESIERAGESHQAVHFLAKRGEGFGRGRDDPVAQSLEVAEEVGERRAELVRGVRDEFRAHPLLLVEARRELIERLSERNDLARSFGDHPHRALAMGEPLRGAADAP